MVMQEDLAAIASFGKSLQFASASCARTTTATSVCEINSDDQGFLLTTTYLGKVRDCTYAHENDHFRHIVNYTVLKVVRQGKSPAEREAEEGKEDK